MLTPRWAVDGITSYCTPFPTTVFGGTKLVLHMKLFFTKVAIVWTHFDAGSLVGGNDLSMMNLPNPQCDGGVIMKPAHQNL